MSRVLSILGSTGSIGVNALHVVKNLNQELNVKYLSAHKNSQRLIEQAKEFRPDAVAVVDTVAAKEVQGALKSEAIEVLSGRDGLLELACRQDVDILVNGLVGSAGMEPTIKAIRAGVDVALSNKESLVMAGDIINSEKAVSGAKIFPVDSEHSAIWQCLIGENIGEVEKIILTGSGGPFRSRNISDFSSITVKDALNHPNWSMGQKITIDSATMMNKGLEVIEARWLFDISVEKIDIVIHPESIIHSMVEFVDGSVKAQLGVPDMKVPIQYALTYPNHAPATWEKLSLPEIGSLTFESPDLEKFPAIQLAFDALKKGGSCPAVLNVANEQAVYRFLKGDIHFTDIPKIIDQACQTMAFFEKPVLEDILSLELETTRFVQEFESQLKE
ncbi:MAG: 1-deoxy-D-xylulose-5-phosphate reductoisomerase [Candidatus Marinimicrobia bacterium]|nr:1-deoxy-D-xylulose-5-phosphate reductoisomerase [Candidatus Neomarinimicrobiota bacterium]MBL7059813.1 1-deoxy-D-xylulose-5-phosphate reductoisomerase [Candidatus Neomarinimicrobiota bacterium]